MVYKIATWNVNSLRVRLPQVLQWLAEKQPDVLALQETKLQDDDFPLAQITAVGYLAYYNGQKTYNGVATFIKKRTDFNIADEPLKAIPHLEDQQRRVLGIAVGELFILNVYVPNGESVQSEKYQYKLKWLQQLHAYVQSALLNYSKMLIVGDFNIAPAVLDVHDPAKWEGQVLFSQPEREAFEKIIDVGFEDCFRKLHPLEQQYTWWDYRLNAFKRKMGLRIDHILASKALSSACQHCEIDLIPRAGERPSDHAPVMATFLES